MKSSDSRRMLSLLSSAGSVAVLHESPSRNKFSRMRDNCHFKRAILRTRFCGKTTIFMLLAVSFLFSIAPARADDFCHTNIPVDQRSNRPFKYETFQTGWIAFRFSSESIDGAIAKKDKPYLSTHTLRLCQVVEGLRPFANRLDDTRNDELLVALNQVQGSLAAMESASLSGEWARLPELKRQFNSVAVSIEDAVPPCWRKPIVAHGKRGKLNVMRNPSCR
jgi:hypothetical protein